MRWTSSISPPRLRTLMPVDYSSVSLRSRQHIVNIDAHVSVKRALFLCTWTEVMLETPSRLGSLRIRFPYREGVTARAVISACRSKRFGIMPLTILVKNDGPPLTSFSNNRRTANLLPSYNHQHLTRYQKDVLKVTITHYSDTRINS